MPIATEVRKTQAIAIEVQEQQPALAVEARKQMAISITITSEKAPANG